MPTLETAFRTVIANAILTEIDSGAASSIQFQTAVNGEVATVAFQDPSFSEASGVLTLLGVPLNDPSASGDVAAVTKAKIFRDGILLLTATAGAQGGEEITMTSDIIAATEQVNLTSLTITVPAS